MNYKMAIAGAALLALLPACLSQLDQASQISFLHLPRKSKLKGTVLFYLRNASRADRTVVLDLYEQRPSGQYVPCMSDIFAPSWESPTSGFIMIRARSSKSVEWRPLAQPRNYLPAKSCRYRFVAHDLSVKKGVIIASHPFIFE